MQASAKEIEEAIEEQLPDADDSDALLDFQQVMCLYQQLMQNHALEAQGPLDAPGAPERSLVRRIGCRLAWEGGKVKHPKKSWVCRTVWLSRGCCRIGHTFPWATREQSRGLPWITPFWVGLPGRTRFRAHQAAGSNTGQHARDQ